MFKHFLQALYSLTVHDLLFLSFFFVKNLIQFVCLKEQSCNTKVAQIRSSLGLQHLESLFVP